MDGHNRDRSIWISNYSDTFFRGYNGFRMHGLGIAILHCDYRCENSCAGSYIAGWLLALYIVIIDWKSIVFKEYLKILVFVIIGLPIGMWLFATLPEAPLKIVLGVFMVIVSIRGLIASFICKENIVAKQDSKIVKWLLNVCLVSGGVIHGAFSSGGPFIVIYATRALPSKSNFRATPCALWVTLNSVIIIKNFATGIMTSEVLRLIAWMIPFLALAMIVGNMAHKRIKGHVFVKVVFLVLLVSGIFMFFSF